jgi:hypothetical protein
MEGETKIITAIIKDRSSFHLVEANYESGDLSDVGEMIFEQVELYYKRDSKAQFVDHQCILDRLCRKHPKAKAKFVRAIGNLKDISLDNVMEDYRAVKRAALAEKAGSLLMAGSYELAAPLLAKFDDLGYSEVITDDTCTVYNDAEASDFCESIDSKNRIPIAPTALNEKLGGGLIAGCHMLIYAPPECGKTAFAINIAYSIAVKGRTVLYVGNEESADMYLNRMLCRFCRKPLTWVLKDKDAAMALARRRGWKNLHFAHMSPGSIAKVQSLALEIMPDVVIIDQLSNLRLGKGKEPEKTVLLEKLAYQMRIFYSKNKIAGISMSQADEKAIDKLYLEIKNVYYSNIGVQGMCDVMIGMGMNKQYQQMGRRVLNLTKNKLGGVHEAVIVQLINEISMLKGL